MVESAAVVAAAAVEKLPGLGAPLNGAAFVAGGAMDERPDNHRAAMQNFTVEFCDEFFADSV